MENGCRTGGDGESLALAGVELHQPFPFPLTNAIDVLLEEKAVLAWSYIFLHDTVISEESDFAVLGPLWEVVDERQKQDGLNSLRLETPYDGIALGKYWLR